MSHSTVEEKPGVSSGAAWAVGLLLAAFLIMAINFIKVSSGGHHEESASHHTEEGSAPAHH